VKRSTKHTRPLSLPTMVKAYACCALLGCMFSCSTAVNVGMWHVKNSSQVAKVTVTPPHVATQVQHVVRSNATAKGKIPCQCEATNPSWQRPTRTVPKCVFIDLGAADGNSFNAFLNNKYGALTNCPSGGQWEAVLVEANPRFDAPLKKESVRFPESVELRSSTAAYMCRGQTSFYLDTVTTAHNYWGSSMSDNHPDVVNSGKQKVTVNTVNLNQLLVEKTIPGDYVLVKMDIEGAEFDIIPCLAGSPSSSLMDALWLEQHDVSWGTAGNSLEVMNQAKAKLQAQGVYMPAYFSETLLAQHAQVKPHSFK